MKRNCLYAFLLPLIVTLVLLPVAVATECPPPPSCDPCEPRSPGYWKNHPEAWPMETIQIGDLSYTRDEVITLMKTPVRGDKTITLLKAVVAVMLNVYEGCTNPCDLVECLDDACALLTQCGDVSIETPWPANSETWQRYGEPLYECLEASYRGGDPCSQDPDPCPEPDPCPPPPECDPCEPRSPGYWKNHPDAWPLSEIRIGEITYTKSEAIAWMNTPVKGDKSLTLFKAYVAAILNAEAGCPVPCELSECLDSALTRLSEHQPGSEWAANTPSWQHCGEPLYECLEASYNGM